MSEIDADQKRIIDAADEVAAATNFKGHGYDIFIQSREKLKEIVNTIITKYKKQDYKKQD